jgi:hypothetical protein
MKTPGQYKISEAFDIKEHAIPTRAVKPTQFLESTHTP